MIPSVDSFTVATTTRDAFGKITSTAEHTYGGVIDRQTQFRSSNGETTMIGEGMVITEEIKAMGLLGSEITIDGLTFTITQVYDAYALGVYHHTELIYG